MTEGWDKIKGYLLDNPTLALTLLYLYVTAVGMLYAAVLYGRFGINIFDYSEIPDFLLAAFKNPIVLLLTGFQVFLFYGYIVMLTFRKQRVHERQEARERVWAIVVSTLSGVAFLGVTCTFALVTASSFKNGNKSAVEVRYRSFSGSAGQVTAPGLEFIGATQRAAFFYDVDDKRTIVIPQSQLVSIEVPEQD